MTGHFCGGCQFTPFPHGRISVNRGHIPLAGHSTRPVGLLLPRKSSISPLQCVQVAFRGAATYPITQSLHIILGQLLAAHQVLNPPIESRDRPRIRHRGELVWLGRPSSVDFHVVVHWSVHAERRSSGQLELGRGGDDGLVRVKGRDRRHRGVMETGEGYRRRIRSSGNKELQTLSRCRSDRGVECLSCGGLCRAETQVGMAFSH